MEMSWEYGNGRFFHWLAETPDLGQAAAVSALPAVQERPAELTEALLLLTDCKHSTAGRAV